MVLLNIINQQKIKTALNLNDFEDNMYVETSSIGKQFFTMVNSDPVAQTKQTPLKPVSKKSCNN